MPLYHWHHRKHLHVDAKVDEEVARLILLICGRKSKMRVLATMLRRR
jgi:hypothetical protein